MKTKNKVIKSNSEKTTFGKDEDEMLQKLYQEQQKNIEMGYEFYGISEKLNSGNPIPMKMSNYEIDYEIREIRKRSESGKGAQLIDSVYKSRVPEVNDKNEIAKLYMVKNGWITASTVVDLIKSFRLLHEDKEVYFDIDVEHLSEENVKKLHKELQIVTDRNEKLIVYGTKSVLNKRVLRVKEFVMRTDREYQQKWQWDKEYLHFVLKKQNVPFKKPLTSLAASLNLKQEDIGFAQLKEALPKSVQYISVPKPETRSLLDAVQSAQKYKIGNFKVRKEPIKIGDLDGNQYLIALRNQTEEMSKEKMALYEERLKALQKNGFINYFGDKRFQNKKGVAAYQIGKALLTRNYQEAVELVMTPLKDEQPVVRTLKELWYVSKGNAEKTLKGGKAAEKEFEYEIVTHLKNHPLDYEGALEKIPLNFRLGYIFAYQSYIWNVIASQRIKRKGLHVFEGDLVLKTGNDNDLQIEFYEDYSVPIWSRSEPLKPLKRDPKTQINNTIVKFVTKEDIAEKKYTIYDLVLPLPGGNVLFPKNDVGIWYTDFLSKDGLSKTRLLDKYFNSDKEIVMNTTYFLNGSYRKLIAKPKDLKWEFKPYKRLHENLFHSRSTAQTDRGTKKMALTLDFVLRPDSYVNMALREIVHIEKSGFIDMVDAYKSAKKIEEKEIEERERQAVKPRDRLDGGGKKPIKERLDGGISRSNSLDKNRRTQDVMTRQGGRAVSGLSNRIEVRLTNDIARRRSNSIERVFEPEPSRFPNRFEKPRAGQQMLDGVPVCEFNTLPVDPISDRYEKKDDVWETPPREVNGRFESYSASLHSLEEEKLRRGKPRQSVFDGRLEPRDDNLSFGNNRNDRDVLMDRFGSNNREFIDERPTRSIDPPSYMRRMNPDDLRNRLNENTYDPEREFERFEREVNEMNRGRSEFDREQRFNDRFGSRFEEDRFRAEPIFQRRVSPMKRSISPPRISPETAAKLRRLDEEALRLDLQRVSRNTNMDAMSSNSRNEGFMDNRDDWRFNEDRNIDSRSRNMLDHERETEAFSRDIDKMLKRRFEELQRKRQEQLEFVNNQQQGPQRNRMSFERDEPNRFFGTNDRFSGENSNSNMNRPNDDFIRRPSPFQEQAQQRSGPGFGTPNNNFQPQQNWRNEGMPQQQQQQQQQQPPLERFGNQPREMDMRDMLTARNMQGRQNSPPRQWQNQGNLPNIWDNRGPPFQNPGPNQLQPFSNQNSNNQGPLFPNQASNQGPPFPNRGPQFLNQNPNQGPNNNNMNLMMNSGFSQNPMFGQQMQNMNNFPNQMMGGMNMPTEQTIGPPGFKSPFNDGRPGFRGRGRGRP